MSEPVTRHLVIGLGEIGQPLVEFIDTFREHDQGIDILGRDLDPWEAKDLIHVLHVCFPFSEYFVDAVLEYLDQYTPDLCIIHSTVQPGTTRAIADQAACMLAYSPVRGRHGEMVPDLLRYRKFIAATNGMSLAVAAGTLVSCGFSIKCMEPLEALELAKLLETSYSGLLIGWAQEMERFAEAVGASYWDIVPFLAEIDHLPRVAFQPGHIGGHCIMPNIVILEQIQLSYFAPAIRASNQITRRNYDGQDRLWPVAMSELLRDEQGEDRRCCACECS